MPLFVVVASSDGDGWVDVSQIISCVCHDLMPSDEPNVMTPDTTNTCHYSLALLNRSPLPSRQRPPFVNLHAESNIISSGASGNQVEGALQKGESSFLNDC